MPKIIERLKSFECNGFTGYVWNFIIRNGKKVHISDDKLAEYLSKYYDYEVVISDGTPYGWSGSPSDWEGIIIRPGDDSKSPIKDPEFWDGRLSLEEVDHHGENQSGRQPKVIK